MATDIGTAYVQIEPSMKGISNSITSMITPEASSAGSAGGLLLGTQLLGSLKGALGVAAVGAALKGLTDGIGSCVTEYANFDEAMSQVAATMGVSKDSISDLADVAKEMGATTSFSAEEAAEGLNILAMAGLDADEQMAVLPTTLDLAAAGSLELSDAADYVTGAVLGFGDSMDNAQYYSDLMAKGATLAKTDVNDLGEAMSSGAATASTYGQSAEGMELALLKLANQGVTGTEATTALNRAMADLYTPTSAAKEALESLGVDAYDPVTHEARDFNDVCDDLSDALSGMEADERSATEATIFTTRGMNAFNKICATSKDTSQEFADALADSYGSAADQAATQLDNLNGDLTLYDSAVSGFKIAIGEKFDGICRAFVQFGTDALGEFTELIDGTKSLGDVFSDIWNGIVDWFQSVDWVGIGTTVKDGIINGVKTLVQEVPAAIGDFVSSVVSFIQSVDWVSVGLQVAEFIINGLKNLVSMAGEAVTNFCDTVKNFISNVDWHSVGSKVMETILNGLKALIVDVPQAIGDFVTQITGKISETDWLQVGSDILQGIIDGITSLIDTGISAIGDFCSGIFDAVTGFFGIASPSTLMMEQGEYITEGLVEGMNGMSEGVDGALQETLGVVTGFGEQATAEMTQAGAEAMQGINAGYSQVPVEIKNPLDSSLSNISGWGDQAGNQAATAAKTFNSNTQSGLSSLPSTVQQPLTSSTANVNSWSSEMSQRALTVGKTFVTNISSGLSNLSTQISNKLSQASSTVTNWGTTMGNAATSIATTFVNNFSSGLSSLSSKVSSALSSAVSTANSYSSNMSSAGQSVGAALVNGMISGINSKSSSLYSTISSVVSKAVSTANSAAGTGSPSRYLAWTGRMMDEGLALGLRQYADEVDDAMASVMSVMDTANNMDYATHVTGAAGNGKAGSGTVVNVTQNIYDEKRTAAALLKEARHEAQRAVITGVYA